MAGIAATAVGIQNAIANLTKEKSKSEQCPSDGKWTCLATCHETPYGGGSGSQRIISLYGNGPTHSTACQSAIKNCQASAMRGTYTRHCKCPQCWKR